MASRRLASLGLFFGVAAVLELVAFGFFSLAGDRFSFPDPGQYLATEEEARQAAASFDADLGWVVRYDTPFGERPRETEYGRVLAAAFGDSFTHGDEVGHSETWPAQLAALLGGDVYNYGASAYGMDQALLRMERDAAKTPAPVHVMGFMTYDIERNVSVYWKFMAPQSGMALTKPRFLLRRDSLELLPNAIDSADRIAESLRDEDFLRRLGQHDDWYNRDGLPALGFPYLARLFHPAFLRSALGARKKDLWAGGEALEITERILVRFRESSRERGARALLVHLPVTWEVNAYLETGRRPTAVDELERICDKHALDCLAPLHDMNGMFQDEAMSMFTRDGALDAHYSRKGNGWMAEKIAAAIWDLGLMKESEVGQAPSDDLRP